MSAPPSPVRGYQCDRCLSVSVDPADIAEQFCGDCHLWNTGVTVIANWDDPWSPGTRPVVLPATWGCATISHARLGWCASCPRVRSKAELLAWRLLAMGDATVPGYRGAIAFSAQEAA